jgi:hypothetical protein
MFVRRTNDRFILQRRCRVTRFDFAGESDDYRPARAELDA